MPALATNGAGGYGLVAGEASGDNLGAPLIEAIRARDPGARFVGIAGPRMRAAGCEAWFDAEELAVMGLAEVLRHLPRLLRLRRDLIGRLLAAPPEVHVGIDSPEFNLRVSRALKQRGVPTVQYVSPQVWAWRQGRVRTIGESVDLVLCVLPFEVDFYREHGVRAEFVGHPLADRIPLEGDRDRARAALGLPSDGELVAVLPGSRAGEYTRLGPPFAATLAWLAARRPGIGFVAPMANAGARASFEASLREQAPGCEVRLVDGEAERCMEAADAVLLASGTATLEATLVKRPMVVAYRVAPLTNLLLRSLRLVKTEFFSQPNLLAGRRIVPEFFQREVRPDVLGPALAGQLERVDLDEYTATCRTIHESLRRDASVRAADAIVDLATARRARV